MRLWDGENRYSYALSPWATRPNYLQMSRSNDPDGVKPFEKKNIVETDRITGLMLGYVPCESQERFDQVFENCKSFSLRQESIRGQDCYVIDAEVEGRGQYTLWIDPSRDYNIARYHIQKSEGDRYNGRPLAKGKGLRVDLLVDVMAYQKVGDAWFPKQVKTRTDLFGDEGGTEVENWEVTDLVLNPDHEALNSFSTDEIPNGTVVKLLDISADLTFRWENGQIVGEDKLP